MLTTETLKPYSRPVKFSFVQTILAVLIFSLIVPAQPRQLIQSLDSLTSLPFFDTSVIGLNIFDAVAGKTIYSKNDKLLLHPASNMKIITSAAALLYLGPDYRFSTRMFVNGEIKDSVLFGDVIFKGGGDPDITTADIDTFALALKLLGIRKITGSIVADVSLYGREYWGKGWMWDDDPSTDAPFLTPLCVNKNTVDVTVHALPGSVPTVEFYPASSIFSVSTKISIDSTRNSAITIGREYIQRSNCIIIGGTVNPRDTVRVTESLNVVDPSRFFLDVFAKSCRNYGILTGENYQVSDAPITGNLKLAAEKNRTLKEILLLLNKNSVNLSAELVLRAMGSLKKTAAISAGDGIRYIDSLIQFCGFNPRNYRIVDGSGVSHYNLVSAELLAGILKKFFYVKPELYSILRDVFPWAGIDGTLAKRMINQPKLKANVYAKTGTLSGVSCLSGYLHTAENRVLIFSIMMQNHYGRLNRCYELQHAILSAIAENN